METEKNRNLIDRSLLAITNFMAKIPGVTRTNRWAILAFFTLMTAVLAFGVARVPELIDMSMETFLKEDHTVKVYRLFKHKFGSDDHVMIMYEPTDGDIFSPASLKAISVLEDDIALKRAEEGNPLQRITRVRSIVSADYLISKGDALINREFIGDRLPTKKEEVEKYRKQAMAHKDYPGTYFSNDSKLGVLTILTDFGAVPVETNQGEATDEFDFEATAKEDKAVRKHGVTYIRDHEVPELGRTQMGEYSIFIVKLKEILKKRGWANTTAGDSPSKTVNYVMAGNPWMMHFFDKQIVREMIYILAICIVLIAITLGIAFRSATATLWPILVILLSVIWSVGLIGLLGVTMSMMINIVIILALTVGVAASIHVLSGFRYYMAEGMNEAEALTATFRKSGLAIMLATVTTMAGMFSLVAVPIEPVKNLAIMATVGVFFTSFGTLVLLPTLMSLWAPTLMMNETDSSGGRNIFERFFQDLIEKVINITRRRSWALLAIFAVIVAVAASGYPRVIVDTNLVEQVKPGYGLKEAYEIIDKHFGGTASMEVVVDTGELEGMKNVRVLNAMEALSTRILKERSDFVARTNSMVKATKESYQNMTDGSDKNYRIPQDQKVLVQTMVTFDSADPKTRALIVDDEWRIGRISLQIFNKSAHEYEGMMDQIDGWANSYFADVRKDFPKLQISLTGGIPLIMRMKHFVTRSQIISFGIALGAVCLILLVVYGSFKFGLLALVPNIFPIAIVLGVIGWFKIPLDTETLLVMPIAIGIAVDDTIHFLTHYRTAVLEGESRKHAIESTLREVGQAIMFTSVILSMGFLIFLSSAHNPLSNFGLLSAIAIMAALFGDLFMLPALLLIFKPFKKEVEANEAIKAQPATA